LNADSWDASPSDLYTDFGLGVRLNLPFGPLAFDYAFPLQVPDPVADKGGQFQFYLDYRF
jgi:outer membrane protein insertion porin family